METIPLVEIGYSYDTRAGAIDGIEQVLERDGIASQRTKLPMLAGPNDTIQLISNHWHEILGLWALKSPFFDQLWKNAADALWRQMGEFTTVLREHFRRDRPQLPGFSAIGTAAGYARNVTGANAIAAIPIKRFARNAGLSITSIDSAELAWQLGHLALMADRIQTSIEAETAKERSCGFEQNGDCSIKLELAEDGVITVRWKTSDTSGTTEHIKSFAPGEQG